MFVIRPRWIFLVLVMSCIRSRKTANLRVSSLLFNNFRKFYCVFLTVKFPCFWFGVCTRWISNSWKTTFVGSSQIGRLFTCSSLMFRIYTDMARQDKIQFTFRGQGDNRFIQSILLICSRGHGNRTSKFRFIKAFVWSRGNAVHPTRKYISSRG